MGGLLNIILSSFYSSEVAMIFLDVYPRN